jgi:hypothetical protein
VVAAAKMDLVMLLLAVVAEVLDIQTGRED